MPILNRAAKVIAKPFPRAITPKAHAIMDYVSVGSFLTTAVWLWRRNKRAALASLICGGAGLVVNLLTDYPGGVKPMISFRKHLEIDLGLAGMTATMPEVLGFRSKKRFFLAQGVMMTTASELSHHASRSLRLEQTKKHVKVA